MSDNTTVRLVIGTLALLAFTVVTGGVYLTAIDKALPGELIAIGSAAAGAVAGILSKTGHSEPQEVTGPRGGPVPIVDEGGYVSPGWVTAAASVGMFVILALWGYAHDWFAFG